MPVTKVAVLKPIIMAARSKAGIVFDRSNTSVMGSNPTRGTGDCVLSFYVQVAALRQVDPTSKEFYRLRIGLRTWKRRDLDCESIYWIFTSRNYT
jgi:hypothetical protein